MKNEGAGMMRYLLLGAMVAGLAGCGTVEGFGRDLSGGANRVAGWFE